MLKEAIQLLFSKAEQAKEPKFVHLDGDRKGRKLYVKTDGSLEPLEPLPALREIVAGSIDDLVHLAINPIDRREDYFDTPCIFYTFDGVVLVPNTVNPREIFKLNLGTTREWDWLVELFDEREKRMTVSEAFDFFDTLMPGVTPAGFLDKIGRLKTASDANREAQRDEGSSMIGGIATQKLDEQTRLANGDHVFTFMAFNDGDTALTMRVPCAIKLRADLNGGFWRFIAIDSAFEAAQEKAIGLIHAKIMAVIKRETGEGAVPPVNLHILRGVFGTKP